VGGDAARDRGALGGGESRTGRAAMTIPVIDIAAARRGDARAKRAAAAAIDAAARGIGFFAVAGHGVHDALYREARDAALEFFALPIDEKQRVSRPSREESRGYAALGGEGLGRGFGGAAPHDLKESFAIGPVDRWPAAAMGEHAYPHYTPNVWPSRPAALRGAWERYYREQRRLADDLLRLLAIGLGVAEDTLVAFTDRCYSNLRAQHYPAVTAPPVPGQLRSGAHTDYGAITVLRGDAGVSGLEVQPVEGGWLPVRFDEDTCVINLGDQLAMWSNDVWRSTLHRVVVPDDEAARGAGRLTLGFFHMPNADATIACLPGCCGAERPARYPPVSAGWHKRLKFALSNGLDDVVAAAPESARRAVVSR
jgi:isopenicillin N synthase-like dioxygenase